MIIYRLLKPNLIFAYLVLLLIYISPLVNAQVENAPANHPVYEFLHRMEVKRILPSYHGTIIPISREKVAGYLNEIQERRHRLSGTDEQLLDLYRLEFAYDLGYGTAGSTTLFSRGDFRSNIGEAVTQKQKYLLLNTQYLTVKKYEYTKKRILGLPRLY